MAEYIERKKVYGMLDYIEAEKSVSAAIDRVAHLIDRIPAADVQEVKHGVWKYRQGKKGCCCSKCGGFHTTEYAYCHWCGAKMDGKEDNHNE